MWGDILYTCVTLNLLKTLWAFLKDQKTNTVQQGVSYGKFVGSCVVLLAHSQSRKHPSIFLPSVDYCVHTVLVNYWQQGSPSCLRANALTHTCLHVAAETGGSAHTTFWQRKTQGWFYLIQDHYEKATVWKLKGSSVLSVMHILDIL